MRVLSRLLLSAHLKLSRIVTIYTLVTLGGFVSPFMPTYDDEKENTKPADDNAQGESDEEVVAPTSSAGIILLGLFLTMLAIGGGLTAVYFLRPDLVEVEVASNIPTSPWGNLIVNGQTVEIKDAVARLIYPDSSLEPPETKLTSEKRLEIALFDVELDDSVRKLLAHAPELTNLQVRSDATSPVLIVSVKYDVDAVAANTEFASIAHVFWRKSSLDYDSFELEVKLLARTNELRIDGTLTENAPNAAFSIKSPWSFERDHKGVKWDLSFSAPIVRVKPNSEVRVDTPADSVIILSKSTRTVTGAGYSKTLSAAQRQAIVNSGPENSLGVARPTIIIKANVLESMGNIGIGDVGGLTILIPKSAESDEIIELPGSIGSLVSFSIPSDGRATGIVATTSFGSYYNDKKLERYSWEVSLTGKVVHKP